MDVAMISAGAGFLSGAKTDTNGAFLARELPGGIALEIISGSGERELCAALGSALRVCDGIVVAAEREEYDAALETICRFFGKDLRTDSVLAEKIAAYRAARGDRRRPKKGFPKARVPESARVLDNPFGEASGFCFETIYGQRTRHIFFAPGTPAEFEPMVQTHPAPFFAGNEKTSDAASSPREEDLFGDVARMLSYGRLSLASAESCTGGLFAKKMTDVAGVSAVFLGGVVSYSNELKKRLLGVPESIFEKDGAVSAACARAMVEGLCRATGADCGVSVTGIAGPGGGSAEKPVGLVYVGVRVKERLEIHELHLHGSRAAIRAQTAAAACGFLRALLLENA